MPKSPSESPQWTPLDLQLFITYTLASTFCLVGNYYDRGCMTLPGHLSGNIINIDILMNPAQSDFSLTIIIHFRPVGPPQLYCYLLHFRHFSGYSRLMGPLKVAAHSRVVCPKSSLNSFVEAHNV